MITPPILHCTGPARRVTVEYGSRFHFLQWGEFPVRQIGLNRFAVGSNINEKRPIERHRDDLPRISLSSAAPQSLRSSPPDNPRSPSPVPFDPHSSRRRATV